MITIIYLVETDKVDSEKEWLHAQKIVPAVEIRYHWSKNRDIAYFGMIVNNNEALIIKLRHNLQFQQTYRPR